MKNKMKVGFIGMGIMGLAMAKNAKAAGYSVVVTNRSSQRLDQAKREGLQTLGSPRDMAHTCDTIIIMVTDPAAVNEVLNGPNGVFQQSGKGKTIIQMSTLNEDSTCQFADQAKKKGYQFIDCPVAGSKKQVEAAQLILLVGGEETLIKQFEPLLLTMGKALVHAGPIGKGTALKLCMNLIVAQMTTALCEAAALAKNTEVNPHKIFEVIGHSPALNSGYFQIKKDALLKQDYSPAFSLANMLKDVRFMNQSAKQKNLSLPVNQAVQSLMEEAASEGWGDLDLSVMAKVLMPKIKVN